MKSTKSLLSVVALPLLPLLPLVGCGGDDGPKVMVRPDAPMMVFMDAPVATCAVKTDLGSLSLGSTATPLSSDWFYVPTSGPNMGKTIFSVGGSLPASISGGTTTLPDLLIYEVVKPTAGFVTNTPYNNDPDPNAAYVAAAFVFGDYDSANQTIGNFFYASNGATTLTMISEPDGSLIAGSSSATMFREVDDAGSDIAGGCRTAVGGLAFNLTQMATPFTGQKPDPNGIQPLTPDEWRGVQQILAKYRAQ